MRVVEGRIGADAHEFGDADLDRVVSTVVLEMGNDVSGHRLVLGA